MCVGNSVPAGASPSLARPPLEGDPHTANDCRCIGHSATTVQPDLPRSSTINCSIGTLANGETQTVTLVVRPNSSAGSAARTFTNLARVNTTTFGDSTCNPLPLCSVSNVTSGAGTAIPTFTCQLPAGTASTGAGRGKLASGASKNIFLRFEAPDQPTPTGEVLNNTAAVSANEADFQSANDTEGEQTTTRQRVDLRITKTASGRSRWCS